MTADREDLLPRALATFPARLGPRVHEAMGALTAEAHRRTDAIPIVVGGEPLTVPVRIYADPGVAGGALPLGREANLVRACLLTRHHDGHVREAAALEVVSANVDFVAPFVVLLLGEYVVEIVQALAPRLRDLACLGSDERRRYGRFAVENQALFTRTCARAVSYWNEYYRGRWPALGDYPATPLLSAIADAGQELVLANHSPAGPS